MTDQAILVDLDSLLDTRLGTLALIDEDLAGKAAGRKYLNRNTDKMGDVLDVEGLNETFAEKYKNRDTDTLKASYLTKIPLVINEVTSAWGELLRNGPNVTSISVDINIYPYELSEEETSMLVTTLMSYCTIDTKVSVVSIKPEELRPALIKERWTLLFMYDFDEWLGYHYKSLMEGVKIPDVTISTPTIKRGNDLDPNTLREQKLEDADPFAALEFFISEFVGLTLSETTRFSVVVPKASTGENETA